MISDARQEAIADELSKVTGIDASIKNIRQTRRWNYHVGAWLTKSDPLWADAERAEFARDEIIVLQQGERVVSYGKDGSPIIMSTDTPPAPPIPWMLIALAIGVAIWFVYDMVQNIQRILSQ